MKTPLMSPEVANMLSSNHDSCGSFLPEEDLSCPSWLCLDCTGMTWGSLKVKDNDCLLRAALMEADRRAVAPSL